MLPMGSVGIGMGRVYKTRSRLSNVRQLDVELLILRAAQRSSETVLQRCRNFSLSEYR